ncbi:unnamed protein product [Mytilus coruscus]|uniref:Uncharacterized protein n=1 Tax=Mytilus coruscus TaxID=42192 RepID=A0A6J8C7Z1_MYTCO|nr:unnamed protein product [Mytilus coruscus]
MERLPKFLMKAIDCACEEYGMITCSFHGDNDKTRISIMFSNTDNKQVKRKSGSTRRRDNKRLKEFNDTINDTHVLNVNEIESIDTDSMNIDACTHGTVNECEERTMNTDIPLFGASSFTHTVSTLDSIQKKKIEEHRNRQKKKKENEETPEIMINKKRIEGGRVQIPS